MLTFEEFYESFIYTECPYPEAERNCDECWFDCDEEGVEEC